MTSESLAEKLRAQMRGKVLLPSDDGYDEARKVWNRMVDKRPALIARCTGAEDVVAAVQLAREHELLVSVRGGGHNYAGKAVCDDGLLIDLSQMKAMQVDPVARTVRAQPGLNLGEFDQETQAFGLATPLGVATDTGMSGLALGGGYGWLNGLHGLTCDNLLSAQVVTAEGEVVTASANENEDLYWGLRGGSGNFGIVTWFEFQAHPVSEVLGGMLIFPRAQAGEVMPFYDEFSSNAPDELSTICGLLSTPDGNPVIAIVACYTGRVDEGEKVLAPLRSFGSPMADMIQPIPFLEMQKVMDESFLPGDLYYIQSGLVLRMTPEFVEICIEQAAKAPSPLSMVGIQRFHGAAARVGVTDTAFPHRLSSSRLFCCAAVERPRGQ